MTQPNVDAVHRLFEHVSAGDVDAALADVADDAIYAAPYYELLAEGRDRWASMFGGLRERFSEIHYEVTDHHETVDTDLVIVEARGDNAVAGSDKRYRNTYLHLVRFRDGKIVHWTEYSNPKVFSEAVT